MVEESCDGQFYWQKPRSLKCNTGWTIIPVNNDIKPNTQVPKERTGLDVVDKLAIKNNTKAKKIPICGIGPNEYNRICACQDAKAIWYTLQTAYGRTTQ